MKAEDLFHMGIVSDDPSATREQLTALLGYEWGPAIGGPTAVTLPSGEVTLEFGCSYSVSVPRLEVVAAIPGTLWEPVAGSGIHHLGYWSDDIGADTAELVRGGYVVEATRSAGGLPFFAFLRGDNGIRMELVTRAAEPMMQPCWAAQS